MLDKVHTIPNHCNVATLAQLNAIYKVFELVFDRNASVLPAYLVLDEIQKKMYPKGQLRHHWKFAKLFSSFVDSFHPTAQIVTIAGRCKLVPVVGYSSTLGNAWKLDPMTAKFQLRGLLPYNKELLQPQMALLRHVLEQPYSRDMVLSMLSLTNKTKQRCPALEDQLVELIVMAMERSERSGDFADTEILPEMFLWQHLSNHLIYFVLFHHASFPHMVTSLHSLLSVKNYKKGREHLMWVLLQFISGAIQKNPLVDFLPILGLYDLLYQESEPIPLPDISKPDCTHFLAAASIWIHLTKKAESEPKIQRSLPVALASHVEYLQQKMANDTVTCDDYRVAILCNAHSTNQDFFARPMGVLVDSVQGNRGTVQPLSMDLLDSLTVHTKMSLIHSIVTQIMKMATAKPVINYPSPALIETYSRLLVYTEIESLGIKGFMTQLLNTVFKSQSWSILHTLLEMFVYRLHHIPAHYRVQLLGSLHNLSNATQNSQMQLYLCMESTALKLILGLSSAEVLAIPQFNQFSQPKALISNESEELNKVLVLTLARAIHVTGSETLSAAGNWCKELLASIVQSTPHLSWSAFTLNCFPPVIADFFRQYSAKEVKTHLKGSVEEEYKKWKAMNNDNDRINHFTNPSHPLFLCLLWKMVLESENRSNAVPPVAYKILETIGARGLSTHLRSFADYLVCELAVSYGGQHLKKYVDAVNDMIWKCNVITLDRFLLCLVLRAFADGNNSKVSILICMLLLERPEFKTRVEEFVQNNSPEHWKHNDWHSRHVDFLNNHPEKFFFENDTKSSQSLPVYFSNICLRFIPVMDVIIHRFLEQPTVPIPVETLLDRFGCLYKFHERPITYLYNTLHFYEQKLKDRPATKRRLVTAVVGSFKDVRPSNWAMTEAFMAYSLKPSDDPATNSWSPDLDYYIKLLSRLVDTLNGKNVFSPTDWRFNEFPNASAHALHVTCIELMALPVGAVVVANHLLDVCLVGHKIISRDCIQSWMNATGLVLTALPDSYWSVLLDRILESMQGPLLTGFNDTEVGELFQIMNFDGCHNNLTEVQLSYLIGLTHAVWHHASVGQVSLLPNFLKDRVKPLLKTERQVFILLFAERFKTYHLSSSCSFVNCSDHFCKDFMSKEHES